jgi:hypothetical protein
LIIKLTIFSAILYLIIIAFVQIGATLANLLGRRLNALRMDNADIWDLSLKTLTLLGVIIAAVWAYFTYKDTKEKEFYTQYWNKKLSLFLETSQAAATMATTNSLPDFQAARAKFWELFYGRLSLVEGRRVKAAMEEFASAVPKGDPNPNALPLEQLKGPAYVLSLNLNKELSDSWKKPFSELDFMGYLR